MLYKLRAKRANNAQRVSLRIPSSPTNFHLMHLTPYFAYIGFPIIFIYLALAFVGRYEIQNKAKQQGQAARRGRGQHYVRGQFEKKESTTLLAQINHETAQRFRATIKVLCFHPSTRTSSLQKLVATPTALLY